MLLDSAVMMFTSSFETQSSLSFMIPCIGL